MSMAIDDNLLGRVPVARITPREPITESRLARRRLDRLRGWLQLFLRDMRGTLVDIVVVIVVRLFSRIDFLSGNRGRQGSHFR